MKNTVKLNHNAFRKLVALQHWKQEPLAEALGISVRHVRNLSAHDTDASISLCYNLAQLFGTSIEALLVIQEVEE